MKKMIFMATLLLGLNAHALTGFQACIKACGDQFNPSIQVLNEQAADLFKAMSESSDENEQSALASDHYWIANKTNVLLSKKMQCLLDCQR